MKSIILLIFLTSFEVIPQAGHDINTFLNTGQNLLTSPLRFNEYDWIKFGGVILVTAGSFFIDDDIKGNVLRNSSFNSAGYVSDNIYYQIPVVLTAGTYLYGYIAEDKVIRQAGLDLIESAFYASAVDALIKLAAGRSRPYTTTDVTEFTPFKKSYMNASFGSGHATLAFAVSTVLASKVDNFFWKAGWFTAAGLVGAVRIYHNMHWFSDVVLGASIGYFIGSFVTEEGEEDFSFGITPGGIAITFKF